MNDIIQLNLWQLLAAYFFVVLVLVVLRIRKIKREKILIIASVRMTLQLILTGYVLVVIFDHAHFLITLSIILIMQAFAIYTIFKKFKGQLSKSFKKIIAPSMAFGSLFCLFYFVWIVVRIDPWYDPRYFIPIAGMLIGNSMTGISLGVNSLLEGMVTQKQKVEEALILGATPKMATRDIVNSGFDNAIMPTINYMLGMGIVFLPGMMTGQILSGTLPTIAILYQIAIMLGILGSVALSVILMLWLGAKTFFNDQDQLN